jgi:hypothetical protein
MAEEKSSGVDTVSDTEGATSYNVTTATGQYEILVDTGNEDQGRDQTMTSGVTSSEGEQCLILPENPRNLPVHQVQPVEPRKAQHPEAVELHIFSDHPNEVSRSAFAQLKTEKLLDAVMMYSEVVDNVIKQQSSGPVQHDNPVLRSMTLVRKGGAVLSCHGHLYDQNRVQVKCAGFGTLRGYCEVEPLDGNDVPNGDPFFIGSIHLTSPHDSARVDQMKEEFRILQESYNELHSENLQLRERIESGLVTSHQQGVHGPGNPEPRTSPAVGGKEWQAHLAYLAAKPFKCDQCPNRFANGHSLGTHRSRKHKSVSSSVSALVSAIATTKQHCDRCNGDFESSTFSQHTCNDISTPD